MPIIIESAIHEHPESISTQTSKKSDILNLQYTIATKQEVNAEIQYEKLFGIGSKFQGEETKIYNCHGLTFISKRSGIYRDEVINMILNDEYKEIKSRNDVIVGDIVIYYNDDIITHSSVVVEIRKEENLIPIIKVLSKTRSYKEIVHNIDNAPLVYGSEKKFFRIRHAPITII